ncbi:serine/threonine-protein kinase [Pseudolysobacter antarcticus]|uniref:serine/threonine-protein kinase n=1 Tax=Pseudolysobacter antarcticus TaxID=2511995 RepID=UPI0013EE2E8E|nr:serine/threonine-protein kinase [Pseudolysobacter antarcticus]
MQRERWQRLEQLFAQARMLAAEQRAAWLSRACGDDVGLCGEVEELLRADTQLGVLDAPPFAAHGGERAEFAPSLATGTRVGAWRVETLIGRGGAGEVYAVTRAEVAFTQRAAMKLLRFEAIGELARFDVERRILARLDHPGISRLLDGGIAADGRPYTVMEYVEGVSLIDHCAARHASLRERLNLLMQVCDAVAYAHRNLVVHRDLKPSNTLVDVEGKVKLLDFGIAKLLDVGATKDSADMIPTLAPFTPEYAAPEQLSGETVTTATDVYALGVLLFELLTGERPLRSRGLPAAQVLALLDERVAPPSSRVAREKTDAPLPPGLLTGDLDAIVAKCLRPEPAQRYASVNDLKRDLQRHLAREPVLAREGARLYVIGRLLRRYRFGVAATVMLILALAAGLAGTLWQAHIASTNARTSSAVQTFMTDLFRANSSKQKDPVKARATTARELLDIGAKKIDGEMSDAPFAKLDVLKLLGDLYAELALRKEEIPLRRQVVELTRRLYGADSAQLVVALGALAGAMHGTEMEREREPLLREALAILDRNGDTASVTRGVLLQKFAEFYESTDQAKALDYAQQSVRLLGAYPPSIELAEAWYLQGLTQTYTGQYAAAVVSLNRAIEISSAVQGVPNPDLVFFCYQLADTQRKLRDFAGAERSARRALDIALSVNGEDHIDAVRARLMLGRILIAESHVGEGLDLLAQAKRDVLRLRGMDDPFHTPTVLENSGLAQSDFGDVAAGLADLEGAAAIYVRFNGDRLEIASLQAAIANDLIDLGRNADARRALDEAAAVCAERDCAHRALPYLTRIINNITLARVRLAQTEGRNEEARSLLGTLIASSDPNAAASTRITAWLLAAEIAMETRNVADEVQSPLALARAEIDHRGMSNMQLSAASADLIEGHSYLKRHELQAALPLLQRAVAAREALLVAPNPRIAEAQILLARCYIESGHIDEARDLVAAAAAIAAHYAQLGERYRKPLHELQMQLRAPLKPAQGLVAGRHG